MSAINIKTLSRSAITSGLAQLWRIASRLILTPLIISSIGMEGYGVWTLVFSVAAYVQMTNASFGLAYTKFTAECVSRRRYDELSHIIGSGMTGVGAIALLGLALAWWLGEPIMRWLEVPPAMVADAALALVIVLGVLVLRMTIGCSLEILAGLQRIDLNQRLNALSYLVEFLVSVPLLVAGYGIVGLAVGHALGQVLINVAAYWMVRRRLPQVHISPFYLSREGMRAVLSVGGRFQLLWAVNTIASQSAKIILSKLVGVEWVGVYELAEKLIGLAKTASEAVIAPLMPAFASLRAGGDQLRERVLFIKSSKTDVLMGGVSFTFMALFAHSILLMWTGQTVPQAAWTIQVLAFSEVGLLLTSVVSASLRAQGQVRLEVTWALITFTLAIGLVVVLTPILGFEGVIYSRLIAQLVSTAWYLRAYFSVSGISWGEYLRGTGIPRLLALLLAIAGLIVVAHGNLPPLVPPGLSPRWSAAFELMVWGVPYMGLVGVSAWTLYLEADDRERITSLLRTFVDVIRGRGPKAPEVIVVATAGLEQAGPVVEAGQAVGRTEALLPGAAVQVLVGGATPKLLIVHLGPEIDPAAQYVWVHDNRPELVERMVFVEGRDDPFFAREGVTHYPTIPSADTLWAAWGDSAGAAKPR